MRRALPFCAVLLVLPLAGRAADEATVIRMTVRPAPAPKPALKYQLLPELAEMNPGNPIQAYAKCFAEQHNYWRTREVVENREKWQSMPLNELPLNQVTGLYNKRGPLRYADWAARLDTPDWQILLPLKRDGLHLLLPDIQQLRELAGALKVRFRAEVAERRFDDALYTARTLFALSRHLGEHPTLISELVAVAVGSLAVGPLDEMIQQPGCPNLFWALADLPSPFIDLRKGAQGERLMLAKEASLLSDREPMTDAQLAGALEHYQALVSDLAGPNDKALKAAKAWLRESTENEEYVRGARKRLVEHGLAEKAVAKFPNLQVVLLDQRREVEIWRDDMTKALSLPYWQARRVFDAVPPLKMDMSRMFVTTLPRKTKEAQARLDQRLGLLRCIEALRLYAAAHDGKLPAKLADVGVPLPVDAVTGEPFVYELKGDTAHLRNTPPKGKENMAGYDVRYEVKIAR